VIGFRQPGVGGGDHHARLVEARVGTDLVQDVFPAYLDAQPDIQQDQVGRADG